MGELWFKEICSKCKSANWIYGGDTLNTDISAIDAEGCHCWSCAHIWLFDEGLCREIYGEPDKSIEDMLEEYLFTIEDGKEIPG